MYGLVPSTSSSVPIPKKRLKLGRKTLDSAKEQLLALQEREVTEVLVTEGVVIEEKEEEEEEEELETGIVVAKNISLETYLNYHKQETGLTVDMRLLDGNVIIYEVPLGPHAAVAGEIGKLMGIWHNNLTILGERDVIVDRNTVVRPDASIQPDDLPRPPVGQECDKAGWPYPTVVVEVGLSEGTKSLHDLARRYFDRRTTVQLYLAIKIFGRRRDGTRALLAFLYQRTSSNPGRPVLVKSFGTAPIDSSTLKFFRRRGVPDQDITGFGRHLAPPCNGPGFQMYQINFPATAIFYGSPAGIPPNLMNGFDLDLYKLQRKVLQYV
ncbi:hypothetical protein C1645_750248 [Glomus cerebriforme]|uniref:Putative restriction endonuclease domain-containing protein n=1 Tax=Glomus cerebriforme TaxID=658196 RepID=A0A397TK56_9GLOM|nr:hypothetical protein C1645_750248 [Glomus cerebriforme]